ncbi:hypothetical protein B0681_09660 [Moraxella porci DSM 25326]|uniref:Uncharacterized protein n=1 Tax=Moraxella porci DSM 25326 TaxID=573983 RepID=A0A1T0CM78_9GAMM|nr:hypothetical protein [Moraxella porci]OOS23450.1 hypothetical protein B0681_09660 [Moraxella porci DSM 25326]
MKQLLPLALALFTIGCTTTQPTFQAPQQVSQPIAATAKPVKTHIMYYWVDPITQGQSIPSISGEFYWQDGCLYLLNQHGKLAATFPEFPKDAIQWNEQDKTLTMTNKDRPPKQFTFKMGDVIYANGGIAHKENINMDDQAQKIINALNFQQV